MNNMAPNSRRAMVFAKPLGMNEVQCDRCGLFGMCQVAGMDGSDPRLLDRVVRRRERVQKGQELFRLGDRFADIFAVKSGAFKAVRRLPEGHEQIVGFYLPGELIGLEALAIGQYEYSINALEPSAVCRLHLDETHRFGERQLAFQQQLVRAMSRRILHEQWMSLLMGMQSAEQRVAAFMVSLSNRLGERGLPADSFRLPMSRQEIADYLGLAVETISRMLRLFQRRGLLEARGRQTRIFDIDGLKQAAALTSVAGASPGGQEVARQA